MGLVGAGAPTGQGGKSSSSSSSSKSSTASKKKKKKKAVVGTTEGTFASPSMAEGGPTPGETSKKKASEFIRNDPREQARLQQALELRKKKGTEGGQQLASFAGDQDLRKVPFKEGETLADLQQATRQDVEGIVMGGQRHMITKEGARVIRDAIKQDANPDAVKQLIDRYSIGVAPEQVLGLPGMGGTEEEQEIGQKEEKTNVAWFKPNEEGSFLTAGNVARTAGVLGGAVGAGIAGAAAISAGLSAFGARTVATKGLSSPRVMQAARGILKKTSTFSGGRWNTKYANKAIDFVYRITAGSKYRKILTGIAIGSIPFLATQSFNDRTDAVTNYSMAARETTDINQIQEYENIVSEIKEMNENLVSIDTLNYPKATIIKAQGALDQIQAHKKAVMKNSKL